VNHGFEVNGVRFGLRTNSSEFGAWLDASLEAFRTRDPELPVFSVVIGSEGFNPKSCKQWHILYRGTDALIRTLDLGRLVAALLAELESFSLRSRSDALYLQASIVSSQSATALIPPGLGAYLNGIERRTARAGVSVTPARYISVDPTTGSITSGGLGMNVSQRRMSELAGVAPGNVPSPPASVLKAVDAVCVLAPDWDAGLRRTGRAQSLVNLASQAMNLRTIGPGGVVALANVLREARCFELALPLGDHLLPVVMSMLEADASGG
jgi:hypothetical protein